MLQLLNPFLIFDLKTASDTECLISCGTIVDRIDFSHFKTNLIAQIKPYKA